MEIEVYKDQQTETREFIKAYVTKTFGIADTDPLALMCDFAYDTGMDPALRLQAAKELLKYTYTVPKATQQVDVNVQGKIKHEQQVARDSLVDALNLLQNTITEKTGHVLPAVPEVADVREPIDVSPDS